MKPIVVRRTKFQRLIRLPKMWYNQFTTMKDVPLRHRFSFMWEITKITMKG